MARAAPERARSGHPTTTFALDDDRDVAGQARRAVAGLLLEAGLPEALVHEARSVVTELVVAALLRGWAPETVTVAAGPRRVRVDVAARGRRPPPTMVVDRQASMDLVARLSVSHGSQPIGDGRRWWAVLERPPVS